MIPRATKFGGSLRRLSRGPDEPALLFAPGRILMARCKIFVPLVFALLLAVPATTSAALRSPGEGWSPWLRPLWAAIGCIIDPGGSCAQTPSSPIGCTLDPGGRCGNAPAPAEIGCGLDPGGRCGNVPAPAEIGCTIDPGGRCGD